MSVLQRSHSTQTRHRTSPPNSPRTRNNAPDRHRHRHVRTASTNWSRYTYPFSCSCAEVNKFLLSYVILLKHVYFRQYFACLRKRIFNCCKRITVRLKLKFAIESGGYLRDYRPQWTPFLAVYTSYYYHKTFVTCETHNISSQLNRRRRLDSMWHSVYCTALCTMRTQYTLKPQHLPVVHSTHHKGVENHASARPSYLT